MKYKIIKPDNFWRNLYYKISIFIAFNIFAEFFDESYKWSEFGDFLMACWMAFFGLFFLGFTTLSEIKIVKIECLKK